MEKCRYVSFRAVCEFFGLLLHAQLHSKKVRCTDRFSVSDSFHHTSKQFLCIEVPSMQTKTLAKDALHLDVGSVYYSKWLKFNFVKWRIYCIELVGLRAAQLIPSIASLNKSAVENHREEAEHWSCATTALLCILAKLANTLASSQGQRAAAVLDRLTAPVFAGVNLVWPACARRLDDYSP